MIQSSEQQTIDQLAERLANAYRTVEPSHITRVVNEEYSRFGESRIRDFIPLLVERNSKVELSKISSASGPLQETGQ
jgi:hypothetical protein